MRDRTRPVVASYRIPVNCCVLGLGEAGGVDFCSKCVSYSSNASSAKMGGEMGNFGMLAG